MNADDVTANARRQTLAQLCLSCGLCCDGSFFGSVELRAEDHDAALGALIPLERKAGKVMFRQPCSALQERCCSVYENRPQVCQRYRCRVLRGVDAAPASLPHALEKVAALRASFAALRAQLREAGLLTLDVDFPATIKAFRASYSAALTSGDAAFFTRHRELILRWKKTAWLVHAQFDEKAAARLALPVPGESHPPR